MKMTKQIESLRAIVADESLSPDLRDSAKQQLDDMGEQITQQQFLKEETKPPSSDFEWYCLRPLWERLQEPKPVFEKWLGTADCRQRVKRHDQAVARSVASKQFIPTGDELKDMVPALLQRVAAREHSWNWRHPSVRLEKWQLELQGQCEG